MPWKQWQRRKTERSAGAHCHFARQTITGPNRGALQRTYSQLLLQRSKKHQVISIEKMDGPKVGDSPRETEILRTIAIIGQAEVASLYSYRSRPLQQELRREAGSPA